MWWSFCPTSCGGAKKRDKGETREESAEGAMGMGRDRGRDNEEGFGGSRAGRRGTGRRQAPPAPPPPLSQGKGREGSEEDHREGEGKPSLSSFFRPPAGAPPLLFSPSRLARGTRKRKEAAVALEIGRATALVRPPNPPPEAPPTRARACAPSLFSYVPPFVLSDCRRRYCAYCLFVTPLKIFRSGGVGYPTQDAANWNWNWNFRRIEKWLLRTRGLRSNP